MRANYIDCSENPDAVTSETLPSFILIVSHTLILLCDVSRLFLPRFSRCRSRTWFLTVALELKQSESFHGAGVKLQVDLPADKPVICINLLPMFY